MMAIPFIYFSFLAFYMYTKRRKIDLAILICIIYAISGLVGLFIDDTGDLVKNYSISFFAAFSYCALLTLCLLPVAKFSHLGIKAIRPVKNVRMLKGLSCIALLWFVIYAFASWGQLKGVLTGDMLALRTALYSDTADAGFILSVPAPIRFFLTAFSYVFGCYWILIFLAFFCLLVQKLPVRYFLFFLIASLSCPWGAVLGVDRSAVAGYLISFAGIIVFFWPYMEKKIRIRVIFVGLFVVGALVTYLGAITVSRFGGLSGDDMEGVNNSLLFYIGHIFLYFCYYFDNFDNPMKMSNLLLPFTNKFVFGDELLGGMRINDFLESKIPGGEFGYFYTFIGQIQITAGHIVAILFCFILFYAGYKVLGKRRGGIVTPKYAFLYFFFASFMLLGLFAYFYQSPTINFSILSFIIIFNILDFERESTQHQPVDNKSQSRSKRLINYRSGHFLSLVLLIIIFSVTTINAAFGSSLKTVYVSTSEGNDLNSGQTPDTPLRTLKRAGMFMPDTIYLKRGDIFYESIKYGRSSLIGYGKGAMPVLSGYKRIIKPSWKKVRENVWTLNLTEDNFTGYQVDGSSYLNNIGCIHEYDKDLIHGRRVEHFEQLKEDWDIWQCEGHGKDLPASSFDSIYLYLSTNPNTMKLEFSVNICAANMYEKHPIINGIRFEGFNTAVNFNMSGDIINSRIDAMGGNLFLTNAYGFVCAGNGIQYWVGRYKLDNSVARGNYITRCYDCGITIQGDGSVSPKDIMITDNLITNCCQGWEDFIHNDDAFYDNCVFKNNIVVFSGNTGWGYPASRFKYCHILQNNSYGPKGMSFLNNSFIGGNYYCSEPCGEDYKSAVWRGNVCYIEQGNFLTGRYNGNGNIVLVPKKDNGRKAFLKERDNAIETYRETVNDYSTRFVVVSRRKAKLLGNKAIKNYLRKHSY